MSAGKCGRNYTEKSYIESTGVIGPDTAASFRIVDRTPEGVYIPFHILYGRRNGQWKQGYNWWLEETVTGPGSGRPTTTANDEAIASDSSSLRMKKDRCSNCYCKVNLLKVG
jgi:hypothetical protein